MERTPWEAEFFGRGVCGGSRGLVFAKPFPETDDRCEWEEGREARYEGEGFRRRNSLYQGDVAEGGICAS